MELLQHGADPSLRNTEQKTALDVADPLTKPVLTGTDYKKDDLLEAARRWFGNHGFSSIDNDNCFTLKWERGETAGPADAAQCELPRERREEVDAVAPGCGLQQDQDCTAAAHPRCWCSRQGQGWLGATAQCLQLWPLWGHDMSKITKMAKKTIMCQRIKLQNYYKQNDNDNRKTTLWISRWQNYWSLMEQMWTQWTCGSSPPCMRLLANRGLRWKKTSQLKISFYEWNNKCMNQNDLEVSYLLSCIDMSKCAISRKR